MKVAIYHNLANGGAMVQMNHWVQFLRNRKIQVKTYNKKSKLNLSRNTILHLLQTIFFSIYTDYRLAKEINSKKFDAILVFPCRYIQSPFILHFLKNKEKVVYIFAERKREFYEDTSFFDKTFKKRLSKMIRLPLKIIDYFNCRQSKNVITNSYYSNYILKETYGKIGTIIYPSLRFKSNKSKAIRSDNKNMLSIGNLLKTKGYDFSVRQLSQKSVTYRAIGSIDNKKEADYIFQLAKRKSIKMLIFSNINDSLKKHFFKKTDIFLANQLNEPFGISTIEASSNNIPVLGINSGGTPEIIYNGINGFLYPNNIKIARHFLKKKSYQYSFFVKTDWKLSSSKLLKYIRNLTHTTHD